MSGAILPLPNTPSWHDAQFKHRDNFTCTFAMYDTSRSEALILLTCICCSKRSVKEECPFICSQLKLTIGGSPRDRNYMVIRKHYWQKEAYLKGLWAEI
jgi:hypothetical protein